MSTIQTYGVYRKGGSVGTCNNNPVKTFTGHNANADAKAYAKRMRAQLSQGERKYYKMTYITKPIKTK